MATSWKHFDNSFRILFLEVTSYNVAVNGRLDYCNLAVLRSRLYTVAFKGRRTYDVDDRYLGESAIVHYGVCMTL